MPAQFRGMTIKQDTREQLAYTFECVREPMVPYRVLRTTLSEGDYQVTRTHRGASPADTIALERKSLEDLHGTVGRGRARFERELTRLQPYGYAAIIIEAPWHKILRPDLYLYGGGGVQPKSMMASLLAWSQRFGIHVFTFENRSLAEIASYRMMERWWRDANHTRKD
jgi:DNA excision repair protein ERCC-4